MPELPEVEVVRRGLDEHIHGGLIHGVEVLHPRAVRSQPGGAGELAEFLDATSIQAINRRGKYLWLALAPGAPDAERGGEPAPNAERGGEPAPDAERGGEPAPDRALFVHLGMSGQMLLHDTANTPPEDLPSRHVRARARVTVGDRELVLSFVDQRTFGQWQVTPLVADPHGEYPGIPQPVAHIAPDPFEEAFDATEVARRLRKKKTDIKRALLDQTLVSGIGNIYADEALWAAGIAPSHRTRGMRQRDAVAVLREAEAVMRRALAQGGTSFDALYVNVNGSSGYFSRSLNAYGRTGQPCPRCGEPIVRVAWTNRSSHYCPHCQLP